MYRNVFLYLLLFFFFGGMAHAQPQGLDCIDAIPLCDLNGSGKIFQNASPINNDGTISNGGLVTGGGSVEYSLPGFSCNSATIPPVLHFGYEPYGERWFSFEVFQAGELCMNIIPDVNTDNYDYILFNVTNSTCADVLSNSAALVESCNFSAGTGATGFTGINVGATGSTNNECITVAVGQKFLLYVSVNDAVTVSNSGVTIEQNNFGDPGAADIFDLVPPTLTTASIPDLTCGDTQIDVSFDEDVPCVGTNSIGNATVTVTDPVGNTIPPANITFTGASCSATSAFSKDFTINFVAADVGLVGEYTIEIVGAPDYCGNGSVSKTLTFEVLPPYTYDLTTTGNSKCTGTGDGTATVSVTNTGPNPPITYAWSTSVNTSATETDLSTGGPYSVTLNDANSCMIVEEFTIDQVPGSQPVAATNPVLNAKDTCPDNIAGTGAIDLTIAGGASPYTYSWTGPNGFTSAAEDLTGLVAGDYTVDVIDANGCAPANGAATFTVPSYMAQYTISTSSIDDTCGNGLGSIKITSITDQNSGSYSPFTYSWDNGPFMAGADEITGLNSSSHLVEIIDKYGCSATKTNIEVLNFVPEINFSTTNIPDTCAGQGAGPVGSFTVNTATVDAASEGNLTSPFSYGYDLSAPTPGNGIFTDIAAGHNIEIIFEDAKGCRDTIFDQIQDYQPNFQGILFTNDDTCLSGKGSIFLQVNPGNEFTFPLVYQWNNDPLLTDSFLINQTASSNAYSLSVEDKYGCTTILSDQIDNFEPTYSFNPAIAHDTCYAPAGPFYGSIEVTVSASDAGFDPGTIDYAWTGTNVPAPAPNSNMLDEIAAGNDYNLEITDQYGCTANETFVVNDFKVQYTVATTPVNALCTSSTGSITVDQITANFPDLTSANVDVNDPNISYAWSIVTGTDDPFLNDIPSGNYTVVVTDNYGCSNTPINIPVNQTNDPDLTLEVVSNTMVSCVGSVDGEATVNASDISDPAGGYMYEWDAAALNATTATASGLAPGLYNVSVTDANGCETSTSVTIGEPSPVELLPLSDTTICIDGNALFTAEASGGTTDPACVGNPALCYDYFWQDPGATPGDASFLGSPTNDTTIYQVFAEDDNGCKSDTLEVSVFLYDSLTLMFDQPEYSICEGDSQDITVIVEGGNGDNQFVWSTGETDSIINIKLGLLDDPNFSVTVTNGAGCSTPAVDILTTIGVDPLAEVNFTPSNYAACPGDTIEFTINGFDPDNLYQIGFGDNTSSYTDTSVLAHQYNTSGHQTVTMEIVTPAGCVTRDTLEPSGIFVHPTPEALYTYEPNPPTNINPNVVFSNLSEGDPTWWIDNQAFTNDLVEYEFLTPDSTYLCTLATMTTYPNPFGGISTCVDTAFFEIRVQTTTILYVPSAFTPDADNVNDLWGPEGEGITSNCGYHLRVYSRWGVLVFETTDFEEKWNGRLNNTDELVPQGKYHYIIDYIDHAGREKELAGYVFVINPTE